MKYPTKQLNVIPKHIPEQPWYLGTTFTVLVGGILPFGACFVEFFFILSSMWMNQYYYVFGFTALVFVILIVTCAEITVVLCYFQLCSEDYHWWWRSFLTSGSTAMYVFIYSMIYFWRLEPVLWVTYLLYFGYMFMLSVSIFLGQSQQLHQRGTPTRHSQLSLTHLRPSFLFPSLFAPLPSPTVIRSSYTPTALPPAFPSCSSVSLLSDGHGGFPRMPLVHEDDLRLPQGRLDCASKAYRRRHGRMHMFLL